MRRYLLRLTFCLAILGAMVAGWIVYTHRAARLDILNDDDSYTAGKSIGMVPASKEIYAEGVGFVDSTIFYQAVVRPDEVAWLAQTPEVSPFAAPNHAPLWWRFTLWWHGLSSDMKYFRTNAKWPCLFAYSEHRGMLFGTVEFE